VRPGSHGHPLQQHAGLLGGAPALGLVAHQAAGHQVLPGGPPALADRDDVVDGIGPVVAAFVLADVVIPLHDPPVQPAHEQLAFGTGLGVREDDQGNHPAQIQVPVQVGGVEHHGPAGGHRPDRLPAGDFHHWHIVPVHCDHAVYKCLCLQHRDPRFTSNLHILSKTCAGMSLDTLG